MSCSKLLGGLVEALKLVKHHHLTRNGKNTWKLVRKQNPYFGKKTSGFFIINWSYNSITTFVLSPFLKNYWHFDLLLTIDIIWRKFPCNLMTCMLIAFHIQPQMIPVAANDVAFSVHAVLLTAFTLFQIAIYDVSGPFLFAFLSSNFLWIGNWKWGEGLRPW